jgi:membrane peptidoglycan carboxypeptidase
LSSKIQKPASVAGALFGFVAFSVLAGLLVTVGATPVIALAGTTTASAIDVFNSLPEQIEVGKLQQRNTLYATQDGQPVPFATLYSENRIQVGWDEVAQSLKDAVVAGEDRRFYEHGGVDLTSLVRAGVGSAGAGALGANGGGSTLSMQLVRNIRIAQSQQLENDQQRQAAYKEATETSLARKLEEMRFAIGLEKKYSKDDILLAYLNIAYFGDQAYGVQAAALHYFNKPALDLSAAEAASLIAIVQYPESRNLGTPENYDANTARRDVILRSLAQEKFITQADADTALATPVADYVHLTPASQGCAAVTAAGAQYFCDFVKKSIKDLTSLGGTPEERLRNWRTGGYNVYTTLNLDLTANAKKQIDIFAPGTESRVRLGSVVNSVEAGTGRVIVMAQNTAFTELDTTDTSQTAVNYSTDSGYGNSQGFPAGSTYKPFTLIDWLEKGHGVNETVDGTPRTFTPFTACGQTQKGYAPKNTDGGNPGRVSVSAATSRSINTAYAAMAQKLDLCDINKVAERLGVHRADGDPLMTNSSMFLGTNEVAPLSMAAAYAAIAAGGLYCAPIIVDTITASDGTNVGGQPRDCRQSIEPKIAAAAAKAMSGLWSGGTGAGALPADGYPEIGKTGTTNTFDQNWIIGATTKLATAIWLGNADGAQTSLRRYSSPNRPGASSYWDSRNAFFKAVQTVNNSFFPGTSFPAPDTATMNGRFSPAPPAASPGAQPSGKPAPIRTPSPTSAPTPETTAGPDEPTFGDCVNREDNCP